MMRDIDHIAIVVKSIQEKLPFYTNVLNFRLKNIEDVPHMFVRVAMLETKDGTTHIELVEPTTSDSGVAKFLEKKGETIHHLCFLVDNLQGELDRLKNQGVRLIDEAPRKGEGGSLVAFLHPQAAHGVLIELKQR
ncbi:MAG: methylmalonyl-CoA epimerase [Acidobacteria bacterium]|nr:MAG: methylmalonyl-CoA epimerase [Acidobacteriota bacterium]